MIYHLLRSAALSSAVLFSFTTAAKANSSNDGAKVIMVQNTQDKALADIQTALSRIDKALQSRPIPRPIYPPFENGQIEKWLEDSLLARKTAKAASEQFLPKFAKVDLGNNPGTVAQGSPYDNNDVSRLLRYAASQLRTSDESLGAMAKSMSDGLNGYENEMQYYKGPTAQENLSA
jgi:hypothetical protein